jgi:hypothetical protein
MQGMHGSARARSGNQQTDKQTQKQMKKKTSLSFASGKTGAQANLERERPTIKFILRNWNNFEESPSFEKDQRVQTAEVGWM